jgi:hypothetical protein
MDVAAVTNLLDKSQQVGKTPGPQTRAVAPSSRARGGSTQVFSTPLSLESCRRPAVESVWQFCVGRRGDGALLPPGGERHKLFSEARLHGAAALGLDIGLDSGQRALDREAL